MRFTHSIFIRELRNFLLNETLPLWDSLSRTVEKDLWIPKSTLAYKDFTLNDLSKALIAIKDYKFQLTLNICEVSIIDFTEKEIEVNRISI